MYSFNVCLCNNEHIILHTIFNAEILPAYLMLSFSCLIRTENWRSQVWEKSIQAIQAIHANQWKQHRTTRSNRKHKTDYIKDVQILDSDAMFDFRHILSQIEKVTICKVKVPGQTPISNVISMGVKKQWNRKHKYSKETVW